ncbi:glycoprotein Xg isoform X6 [Sagmatias obliquidens]|uniref:glycoprotein Xg isoform X6 n=1 Tax=Sagmatias obliquidens TaxID=3371155 RepID=UPI000F441E2E|nr:glycoprotein Xg isoform X6 [Lagenorhynchus obliquidens]
MEPWWGLFCLTFLCSVMHVRGQGDFDLADALDDPEPTKKPSSDTYPKPTPPHQPQPGNPDNSGSKKVHSFQSKFDERYLSKAKATATSPAWQL